MKTVLITGANRGIGLEHVRRFAADGTHVYAAVREPDKASALKNIAGNVTLFKYDAREANARAVRAAVKGSLDLLFANAGIYEEHQDLGDIDPDVFMDTIRVNALAPLLLAEALADRVAQSERRIIALQSSAMGASTGSRGGGSYAYRASKAALNRIATTLAADLKPKGVIVVALHPGWVRTDMGGKGAEISVKQSVDGQQKLLKGLALRDTGRFYNYTGKELDW